MHEGVADDGIEKTGAKNQLLRIGPMELDPIEHVIDFDMVARQFEHFARRVGCHHPKAGCLQAQLDWNSRRTGPEIEDVATEAWRINLVIGQDPLGRQRHADPEQRHD